MHRLFYFLQLFRHDFLVMLVAMRNRHTPKAFKGLFLVALLYLVSPIDVLPDTIPLLGIVDDAAIGPAAVCGLMRLLPPAVRAESEAQAERLTQRAPLIVLLVSLLVLAWIMLVVWGCYTFLHWVFVG